jgi:YfiH family protein
LGDHVGDVGQAVAKNREQLRALLKLPQEPQWLRQVHGTELLQIPAAQDLSPLPEADGAVTHLAGQVLVVLTADCLPVLACSRDGQHLGAFHAGWRGLLAGILEKGVAALAVPGKEVLIYLGPAIGPEAFEVGPELRAAFVAEDPQAVSAFHEGVGDRWLADIYQLARQRLQRVGVTAIYGGGLCTFSDTEFFSYRRDAVTGRMASLIWRE